jgi:hypothetical protein
MKGAMAELCAKITRTPTKSSARIMGVSHQDPRLEVADRLADALPPVPEAAEHSGRPRRSQEHHHII